MIICDDHIWSSYMVIMYYDQIWFFRDDHHIWSPCIIITYDDHMWSSYMITISDDPVWSSLYHHHLWGSCLIILHPRHVWSSCMTITYDHHNICLHGSAGQHARAWPELLQLFRSTCTGQAWPNSAMHVERWHGPSGNLTCLTCDARVERHCPLDY